MSADQLVLDAIYDHEAAQPARVFLTQPLGAGRVQDYTWAQTVEQARRMAAHLQSLQLGGSGQIAILSKNCAHFFMAELAIWMAGYTTVAIFPTEGADTVRFVLEHSDAGALLLPAVKFADKQQLGIAVLEHEADGVRSLGRKDRHGGVPGHPDGELGHEKVGAVL